MAYIAIQHAKEKITSNFIARCKQQTAVPGVETASYSSEGSHFKGIIQIRKELEPDYFSENYHEDEQFVVLIDGYVSEGPGQNVAKSILSRYRDSGNAFVHKLNGESNIVVHDKKSNEVKVFTDRFASRPFYFYEGDGELIASNEIKSILPHIKKEISPEGFLEYFLFFHNVDDRTIYKGIKAVMPASILSVNENGFKAEQYWKVSFSSSRIKVKDYAFRVKEVLEKGAEKRYTNRQMIGLGLSGGLDSRLIAATIPEEMRKGVFVRTYGSKDTPEIAIATQIFERLHFKEHLVHEPFDIKFFDFLFSSIWRTEGQIPFWGLKSITQHNWLKDKMHYNLPGHFSDVLTGKSLRPFMFAPKSRTKFIDELFTRTIKLNLEGEIKQVLNKDFFEKNYPLVKENFNHSFSGINASVWDLNNRQARFTFQSGQVDSYIQEMIKLFTDYDYVELMTKLPVKYRFAQVFYKYLIANGYPEIADVVNDNTGVTLKKTIRGNYMDMYDLVKTGLMKRRRRSSTKSSNVYANTRQDQELKKYLIDFAADSAFPDQFLDRGGMLRIIDEHYSGEKDHNYTVGLLATFIGAFDLFILNDYETMPERANPFK